MIRSIVVDHDSPVQKLQHLVCFPVSRPLPPVEVVTAGEQHQIWCCVSGPSLSTKWFHNGIEIDELILGAVVAGVNVVIPQLHFSGMHYARYLTH